MHPLWLSSSYSCISSSSNLNKSFHHLKPSTGNFCCVAYYCYYYYYYYYYFYFILNEKRNFLSHIYKNRLFRYRDVTWYMIHDISRFFARVIVFHTVAVGFSYLYMAWNIPPLMHMHFSTISSISTSVSNSNFTYGFSAMLNMLILVPTKPIQDQAHESLCTYCENFRVHLSIVVYYVTCINHNGLPGFVFQNFPRFFLRVCSQHL